MAKLKKASVALHICPTCKGNGFIKIVNAEDRESHVHQCWDCDSEGEFYETTDVNYIDDGSSTKLH